MLEEIERYDPYTDKFIKNTTTDRIEVGIDGNLYRLSAANANKYLPNGELYYTKADLATMFTDIRDEIASNYLVDIDTGKIIAGTLSNFKAQKLLDRINNEIDKFKENENEER